MRLAPDLDAVTALLAEAAERVILPRFRRLEAHEVTRKEGGANDLVTVADLECERFLAARLRVLLPGAGVVGEEAAAADPNLLAATGGPGPVWIIDPLDGTSNFAEGGREFAVIVALVRDGEVAAGWIHLPLPGLCAVAERGAGAYLGGRRLAVAPPAPLGEMIAVLYVGRRRAPALHARVRALRDRLGPERFARSAGVEYVALARGCAHYAIFTRELPWDHAAGSLIHAEAGGHGAYLDGSPYRPVAAAKPLLLAPDPETWERLRALFTAGGGSG